MSVYMIIEIQVVDEDVYAEYMQKVPETVEKYGGRYVVRGGRVTPLTGGWCPERIIVLEFPSAEDMQRWNLSPEYLSVAPLRIRSTKTRAIAVEGYSGTGRGGSSGACYPTRRLASDLTIRPAEHADGSAVFALLEQLATSYEPERGAFDRHYPGLLESEREWLLVATVGDRVAGYALAFEALTLYANGRVVQLEELAVDSEYRGHGIGRRLVESVVEQARARGAAEVTVPTRRAGGYYLKLGFEETAGYYRLRFNGEGTASKVSRA